MNFTLFPIIVLGAFQSITAILLLAPLPVARIAINLCRASTSPVGKTFLATISVFLIVLLVPPVSQNDFKLNKKMGSLTNLNKHWETLLCLHHVNLARHACCGDQLQRTLTMARKSRVKKTCNSSQEAVPFILATGFGDKGFVETIWQVICSKQFQFFRA